MILGLTGAIGCGKSTACNYFVKRGWRLFDADRCCHDLYADTDGIFCRKIRETWGDECFGSDGKIDRKALAQKVFASEKELGKLTSMLYPELFGQMESEIRKAKEAGENLLCEVPLLFECATEKYFDRTAVVWCNREIRHKRLCLFRNFPRLMNGLSGMLLLFLATTLSAIAVAFALQRLKGLLLKTAF